IFGSVRSSEASTSAVVQCNSLLMLRAERPDSRSCKIKSSRASSALGSHSSLASLGSPFEIADGSTKQAGNLHLRNHGLARGGALRHASPPVVARPKACVSRSNSPQVTPASAWTALPCGSTRTLFIGDRSIISPPSQTALPETLWPPPRTDTNRPLF